MTTRLTIIGKIEIIGAVLAIKVPASVGSSFNRVYVVEGLVSPYDVNRFARVIVDIGDTPIREDDISPEHEACLNQMDESTKNAVENRVKIRELEAEKDRLQKLVDSYGTQHKVPRF
jgi:hypothetical protein